MINVYSNVHAHMALVFVAGFGKTGDVGEGIPPDAVSASTAFRAGPPLSPAPLNSFSGGTHLSGTITHNGCS